MVRLAWLVSGRAEKGAGVAASEYLQATHPRAEGFFSRNLRRMWDFYRMHGNMPELLAEAMRLSWIWRMWSSWRPD